VRHRGRRRLETIAVPETLAGKRDSYVLRVKGDSMIDEQIRDGDFVIIEDRKSADNGEMVIALVGGSDVTLKKIYRENGRVRLQPANRRCSRSSSIRTMCRSRASSSASCASTDSTKTTARGRVPRAAVPSERTRRKSESCPTNRNESKSISRSSPTSIRTTREPTPTSAPSPTRRLISR
jgi:hypothetical protein